MPIHNETQFLPYTTRQLYGLVADIAKYPEFIPWCRGARILERHDGEGWLLAELIISYKAFSECYISRVELHPPGDETGHCRIDVTMVSGPFHHLINKWRFIPLEDGGTEIDFHIDFQFRSRLLETLIGSFFTRASEKMVEAFRSRADVLYARPIEESQ